MLSLKLFFYKLIDNIWETVSKIWYWTIRAARHFLQDWIPVYFQLAITYSVFTHTSLILVPFLRLAGFQRCDQWSLNQLLVCKNKQTFMHHCPVQLYLTRRCPRNQGILWQVLRVFKFCRQYVNWACTIVYKTQINNSLWIWVFFSEIGLLLWK